MTMIFKGIDHLYAIKTIDEVHQANGKIIAFESYCGGLQQLKTRIIH